jgi:GntR family transcriptional regulator
MRRLVASGVLLPGAAVPSVRETAKELQVNPATVAKAYGRLTDAGIFEVRRGDGTYVADTPPPVRKAESRRALREDATRYATAALMLGVERDEAVAELLAVWDRIRGTKGEP